MTTIDEEKLGAVSGGNEEPIQYNAKLKYTCNGMYRNGDKWIYKYDLYAGTKVKLTDNTADFYGAFREVLPEGKPDYVFVPESSIELL